MSNDNKPTRADREAALKAWNGPNPPRVVLAVNDVIKPWLETGKPIMDSAPINDMGECLERIAQAIRDAYELGREHEAEMWREEVEAMDDELKNLVASWRSSCLRREAERGLALRQSAESKLARADVLEVCADSLEEALGRVEGGAMSDELKILVKIWRTSADVYRERSLNDSREAGAAFNAGKVVALEDCADALAEALSKIAPKPEPTPDPLGETIPAPEEP
jgi:hypothetical protein